MKNYISAVVFVLLLLAVPGYAVPAGQLSELKIGPYDAARIDYVEISAEDLTSGKIEIKGSLAAPDEIAKLAISLDAGQSWSAPDRISPFEFSFIPEEEEEYPVIIQAQDKNGEIVFSKVVVLRYISVNLRNEFDSIFEEIIQTYISERLSKFLGFFDPDEYPNFSAFEDNMEATFDDTSNFNLNISIRQVNLQKEEDRVVVKVDWDKSFEDSSSQTGRNNEIHFEKKGGEWKIVYLKDETIFVIGTGTMGGSMTNP